MGDFDSVQAASERARAINQGPAAQRCVVPPSGPVLVPRAQLEQRWCGLAPGDVVHVVAPVGWGATSLLQHLARIDDRDVVWLTLAPDDDDAGRVLRQLAAALGQVGPLPAAVAATLADAACPQVDLLQALAQTASDRAPFVLLVDQVGAVGDATLATMTAAVHAMQPEQVALAGRYVAPTCPPATLKWGPDELAFTPDEIRLWARMLGVDVDDDSVIDVAASTQGWAEGVRIVLNAASTARPPAPLRGDELAAIAFCHDRVLAPLRPEVAGFLAATAVVELIDAAGLDEIRSASDSATLLAETERSAGPVFVPVDGHLRLRPALRTILREQLRGEDPAAWADLERRAAGAASRRGDLDAAITHAIAADDMAAAADFVLQEASLLATTGHLARLAQRVNRLGPDAATTFPAVALAKAWLAIGAGNPQVLHGALAAVDRFDDYGPLPDGTLSLRVGRAVVAGLGADGGLAGITAASAIVRAAGGPATNRWWGLASMIGGAAHVMRDELADAVVILDEVLADDAQPADVRANALAFRALIAFDAGEVDLADQLASDAARIGFEAKADRVLSNATIFATAALMSAVGGRGDEARHTAGTAARMLASVGAFSPRTTLLGRTLLALAADRLADPRAVAEQAEIAAALLPLVPDAVFPERLLRERLGGRRG